MSISVISAQPEDLRNPQILLRELLKDNNLDTVWSFTKAREILSSLFSKIDYPVFILSENDYIDENYSDLYANYYVHSYRNNSKFSKRILIFKGDYLGLAQWFNASSQELSSLFLGEIVIPNSSSRNIGLALIRPDLWISDLQCGTIITGHDSIFIMGKHIEINAFPYRQLDGGLLSCAEVSLLNILDYYYCLNQGYKRVLPSDILKIKDELARFGSSNARGMGITDICNVLQRENLQTIIYMKSALHKEYSHTTQEMLLKRKVYSYIDSGFPCILLVSSPDGYQEIGHSINGIGFIHSKAIDYDILEVKSVKGTRGNVYDLINAADIDSDLIIMDDRCFLEVIHIAPENKKQNYEIQGCIIPIPTQIVLNADDAYFIAQKLLSLLTNAEFEKHLDNNPLILRTCLATSDSFIQQRVNAARSIEEKSIYAQMSIPKYVWVCEFSTHDNWQKKQVDCEIILDATSVFVDVEMSVVSARFANDIIHNNELYNRDEEGNVIFPEFSVFSFKGYDIGTTIAAYVAPHVYEIF